MLYYTPMKIEDQRYVRKRLEYALVDHEATTTKLYTLLSELDIDSNLWSEISQHLADTESHLRNALRRVPECEEETSTDWRTLMRGETLR